MAFMIVICAGVRARSESAIEDGPSIGEGVDIDAFLGVDTAAGIYI